MHWGTGKTKTFAEAAEEVVVAPEEILGEDAGHLSTTEEVTTDAGVIAENATEARKSIEDIILEKDKEIVRLGDALTKRDLEACKLTNFVIENLEIKESLDEIKKENEHLKTENKTFRERYATVDENADHVSKLSEPNTYNIFSCVNCEFVAKTEAGLRVHMGRKHKESIQEN